MYAERPGSGVKMASLVSITFITIIISIVIISSKRCSSELCAATKTDGTKVNTDKRVCVAECDDDNSDDGEQ